MISITAKEKPRLYNLRWNLSNFFIRLARLSYPKNPEVTAFYMEVISDQLIYGRSVIRVDPSEMTAEDNHG